MSANASNKINYSLCKDFQNQVSKVLIRHKSILDISTKLEEYTARINRALAKSITSCGCISVDAKKQDFGKDNFHEMLDSVETHLEGDICPNCSEVLEEEIGSYMFYLAALCDTLDLSLENILSKENTTIKTLGVYSLK